MVRVACSRKEEDVEQVPIPREVVAVYATLLTGMGTKFDYAINLLVNSQSSGAFQFHGVDEWEYSRDGKLKEIVGSAGLARISENMDEPADKYSLESVRRKMQMQEDIFRKQVSELHRLYGVQKKLMGEFKKEIEQNRFSSSMKSPHANYVNCPHQMNQMGTGYAFHLHGLNDDRGSQERSASSSGEAMRIPRGFDLEIRPHKEDNTIDEELPCPSFTAPARRDETCTDDGLDEESDVELTLSIGGKMSKRKSKGYSSRHREPEIRSSRMTQKEHSSASITSDHGDACNSTTSNVGGSLMASDRERKRPHWLFQV